MESKYLASFGSVWRARTITLLTTSLLALSAPTVGRAMDIATDDPDLKIKWTNTVKYSSAVRVAPFSQAIAGGPMNVNVDDGDRNFRHGFTSNRADLLTELDVGYRDFGLRISGAGWYDFAYHGENDNNSPGTSNSISAPYNRFVGATRDLHGQQFELLDGFVYGQTNIGDHLASFRLGRYTLLWGESLFYTSNGIAGTQAPVDFIKATSVPNSLAKELFMPVTQVSGQFQIAEGLTAEAYSQFEWRRNRFPAVGSYFSPSDSLDVGGETAIVGPGQYLYRSRDRHDNGIGQFGVALRYRSEPLDTDFGLYFTRFNSKDPVVYLRPGVNPNFLLSKAKVGEYYLIYPEAVNSYGMSASTVVGIFNVAGEISYRTNAPLQSTAIVLPPFAAPSRDDRRYAVGQTLQAQISGLASFTTNALWDSASLGGELAFNERVKVDMNKSALAAGTTRSAMAMTLSFEPFYFQVLPNLDVSLPVSISHGLFGSSSAVANFSQQHAGTATAAIKVTYRQVWKASLSYANFYGSPRNQVYGDRDFIALSLQRTF